MNTSNVIYHLVTIINLDLLWSQVFSLLYLYYVEIYRQAGRQTNKQTNKQTDKKTDRQAVEQIDSRRNR